MLRRPGKAGLGCGVPGRLRVGRRARASTSWSRWTPTSPTILPRCPTLLGGDRRTAPTWSSARATSPAARSPTGRGTARRCRAGGTATPLRCSAWTWPTPPPATGPTGRRCSTDSTSTSIRADGYGFQIEMTYRTAGPAGTIVEVPDLVHRPHARHVEDVGPHHRRGDRCWSPGGASPTGSVADERTGRSATGLGSASSWSPTTRRRRWRRCSTASRWTSAAEIDQVMVSDDASERQHLPRRRRLPGDRGRPAPRRRPSGGQPRLRRQPEVGVPLGDRARPRHRGAAPRRRAVRARAAPGHRGAPGRAARPMP